MKIKNIVIAAVAALAFGSLTACGSTTYEYDDEGYSQEAEDCDAEDMIEGDEDCYGVSLGGSKAKHKAKHKHPKTGSKSTFTRPKATTPKVTKR